ncbi:ribosome-binding factor A [Planctomycetales bacterium]|nr:ribosome-binding factor A [Planctomycetales bacterium]
MTRRTLKAAEMIRQVVAMTVLTEVQDPRVQDVTVTRVDVSGDMQSAKVYVSVMGDDAKQNLCLKGLKSCAGFLQSKIAKRMDSRYIPHLNFLLDQGVKNQLYVSKVLSDILPNNKPDSADEESDEDEWEDEVEEMEAEIENE